MIARWFGLAWRVAAAGVFVYLTTALLFAFFGWWAVAVPVAWVWLVARDAVRRPPASLEARLFAVGLARTNDV